MISPRRRCAVADPDGDDRKRRGFFRPWRDAVADDDQQIDRRGLSVDERAQPDTNVRAAPAIQLDRRARERLLHRVHGRVAARHDHVGAVAELTRQTSQLRDRSRQLRVPHRAGCIDQETRTRPRLVEAGHDEVAVAGLPAMRPPVCTVVSAERAVAQGPPHRVTETGHVIDLRRERRMGPAPPGERDLAGEPRLLFDAPRHLATHELGLDPVHTRHAIVSPVVGRKLPESPFAVCTRPAVQRGLMLGVTLRVFVRSRRRRQLVVVALGAVPALQAVLGRQRRIPRQRQSFGEEIVVDLAVARGVPAPVVADAQGLLAFLVVAQEMAHLVDEQARVFLDGVRRNPGLVVVQPPV